MKKTTDLWLAGYMVLQGERLADYRKIGPRKLEFYFEMTDDQWRTHRLQYMASKFSDLNQQISKLRELYYNE